MSLVKSISGIRGTIGGRVGDGLNPVDIVRFTAAYAKQRQVAMPNNKTIVVGRDARLSGHMVEQIVCGTLMGMGFDVVNIGLATTPTTELAVTGEKAAGGIILTASHNPKQWNALKLLNEHGEFLNDAEGKEVLAMAEQEDFTFADVDDLGHMTYKDYLPYHIDQVLQLDLVHPEAIKAKNFTVAVDCVNSVGGLAIPALLRALGVNNIIELNCEPTGHFAHNPEPLPQHLTQISDLLKSGKADVGFVVTWTDLLSSAKTETCSAKNIHSSAWRIISLAIRPVIHAVISALLAHSATSPKHTEALTPQPPSEKSMSWHR